MAHFVPCLYKRYSPHLVFERDLCSTGLTYPCKNGLSDPKKRLKNKRVIPLSFQGSDNFDAQ